MGIEFYALNDTKKQVVELGRCWYLRDIHIKPTWTIDEMRSVVSTATEVGTRSMQPAPREAYVERLALALFEMGVERIVTDDDLADGFAHEGPNGLPSMEEALGYTVMETVYLHPAWRGGIGLTLRQHMYGEADPGVPDLTPTTQSGNGDNHAAH